MAVATLTLNPAVDVTYEIDQLMPDRKIHATAIRFDPGGNGINVSRALKQLGIRTRTFCVLAGETGRFLERLLRKRLDDPAYTHIPGETRINCTLLEGRTGSQYEVSGIGPRLAERPLECLLDDFVRHVGQGYGVVTGSVPPGVEDSVYADLIRRIRAGGGRPVLDAHGALLRQGIQAGPLLVKPNRYELEQLVGRELGGPEAVADEACRLIRRFGERQVKIDYLCVSLGSQGAVLTDGTTIWHARPPRVPVRSTVGAGDSMVGALVAGFVQGLAVAEVLRLAVACSAGTVQQPGTELFVAEELPALLEQVEIEVMP